MCSFSKQFRHTHTHKGQLPPGASVTAAVINRLNLMTNSTCSPCLTFCPSLISLPSQFPSHSICISDIFRLSTLNGKTSFNFVGLHGETDFSLIWSIQLNATSILYQVERRSVWLLCKNTALMELKISNFPVSFDCAAKFSAILFHFFWSVGWWCEVLSRKYILLPFFFFLQQTL